MSSITVTISGTAYDVYANVATADAYLIGLDSAAVAWRASTTTFEKERALVMATRWLDQQTWKGEKNGGDSQELEWPRTGTSIEGVSDTIVPADIINASIELAALFIEDASVKSTLIGTGTDAKRLKAGSVEIEYFRGSSVSVNSPLPTSIMLFVKNYLDDDDATGIAALNVSRDSDFDEDFGFREGL